MKRLYIFYFLFITYSLVYSQNTETKKSPKKAAIYSSIIPGSGQVYTKKYWKIPIIYTGIVTSIYFIKDNTDKYNLYKTAALSSLENNYNMQLGYTYNQLITLKDFYRRNREISYFFLAGTYILNIVDASVSAHLFHFDVSEEISLNIQPYSNLNNMGINLSLNF